MSRDEACCTVRAKPIKTVHHVLYIFLDPDYPVSELLASRRTRALTTRKLTSRGFFINCNSIVVATPARRSHASFVSSDAPPAMSDYGPDFSVRPAFTVGFTRALVPGRSDNGARPASPRPSRDFSARPRRGWPILPRPRSRVVAVLSRSDAPNPPPRVASFHRRRPEVHLRGHGGDGIPARDARRLGALEGRQFRRHLRGPGRLRRGHQARAAQIVRR